MKKGTQAGHALLTVMMATAVVATVVGASVFTTTQTVRNAQRTRVRDEAIAVGDAYIEWAFAQWRATCQTRRNSALPTSYFETLTPPPSDLIPNFGNFTVKNFKIAALDADGKAMEGQTTSTKPGNSTEPTQIKAQGGEDDVSYCYMAQADITTSAIGGPDITVKVRRVFEKKMESPWKYAIAYLAADRPALEIHPGPAFTVNGWVHSNGAIYASPDGGNPLNFLGKVTSVDEYFQEYMDGDYQWRGKPKEGAPPTFAPGIPFKEGETRKDAFGIVPSQFDPTDSNKNNDSYRELLERPQPGLDPLTDKEDNNPRFYNTASVKVLIDVNNTIAVYNSAGERVTSSSKAQADRKLYESMVAAVSTGQSIQDNREAASVRLSTLDISRVKPNDVPGWNGVVYISDTSAGQDGKSAKRGIRLKNGSTLPNGGLTVVSDNPVYIQGNYNTSTNRQPSAVLGDAIVILSNNWKDSSSSATLTSRKATDTTVNTAILSGIVPTDPNRSGRTAYSGGVENFPRFLEDWDGRTFNYTGSMVQLFYSQQAIGRWGKDNVYNPPKRNWAFDEKFRTTPPPGTLFITSYVKQRWYLE